MLSGPCCSGERGQPVCARRGPFSFDLGMRVLFQNAAQRLLHRERRTDPAARVSEVSLLQQDPV